MAQQCIWSTRKRSAVVPEHPGPRLVGTHTRRAPSLGRSAGRVWVKPFPTGSPIVGSRVTKSTVVSIHSSRSPRRDRRHEPRREGANLDQFCHLRGCVSALTPKHLCTSRSIAVREEPKLHQNSTKQDVVTLEFPFLVVSRSFQEVVMVAHKIERTVLFVSREETNLRLEFYQ